MTSFDNVKNDKNSYFFNYANNEFDIKSLKNHGKYLCLPSYQLNNNSHLNIQIHDLLPKNSYSNQPFVNGEK